MASNELEVLDPAAPVEKLANIPAGRALNRRNLMAGLGMAGAAVGAGLLSRRSPAKLSVVEAASFPSTFTQTDYLNFLLNIKYLQATYYAYITTGADIAANYVVNGVTYRPTLGTAYVNDVLSKVTFSGANAVQIADMLNEIYYDKVNQLINLQNLIGPVSSVAISRPAIDLLGTNKTIPSTLVPTPATLTSSKALAQARLLEDVAVSAYAGVAEFLSGSNLTAVSQILGGDGAHAGAIRLAIILQNATTAGTVVDLVGGSDVVTQNGGFYSVQSDDVAPVDPGNAATSATGPQPSTAPILITANFTGNTNSSTSITSVSSTAGLAVGYAIAGPSIPSNATITAISGTTLTISSAATATTTGVSLTCSTLQLTNCTAPIAPYSVNGTGYVGCTAPQYQGFFNTTGAATASSNTPPAPGFVMKRTTSQVLSILYASAPGSSPAAPALPSTQVPPLSLAVSTGGFFPLGVNGQINVI